MPKVFEKCPNYIRRQRIREEIKALQKLSRSLRRDSPSRSPPRRRKGQRSFSSASEYTYRRSVSGSPRNSPVRETSPHSPLHIRKRRRIISSDSSSSDQDDPTPQFQTQSPNRGVSPASERDALHNSDQELVSGNSADLAAFSETHPSEAILSLFGRNVREKPNTGKPLQNNIVDIWTGILQKGIADTERKKLLSSFPVPDNCPLLAPPKLNPLILKTLTEAAARRDVKFTTFQSQLGAGIAAVGTAISNVLKEGGESNM